MKHTNMTSYSAAATWTAPCVLGGCDIRIAKGRIASIYALLIVPEGMDVTLLGIHGCVRSVFEK
jgi:hypothetical protein